jgi:large repetitive protein
MAGFNTANAQCSLFSGSGGDIFPASKCAPVEATLQARFFSAAGPDVLSDIKIRVDWADGTPLGTFPVNAYKAADGITWVYEIKDIKHTYLEGGDKCNYEVYARPVVNGTVCNSYFYKGNVTVWDKDNANGGQIALDPPVYYVCPGEAVSITFNDVSRWNCTPPDETDNINYPARWTQFIYGTGTTPGPRINGVTIAGAAQAFPYRGPIKAHPDWQLAPNHQSLLVSVPATAQVGELFEITLRNWNSCNPYDDPTLPGGPANAQDGDYAPVTNVAIIKIIPRPEGTITTKNKDGVATDSFCPGERVRFEGNKIENGVGQVRYDWFIYNDATGTELLETRTNTRTWNRDAGFPTAGPKLVRLRILNNEASNACLTEIEKFINVYAAPTVAPKINGIAGDALEVCWNGGSMPATFDFDLFSSNNYKYRISLYKRNSTATAPDSTVFTEQNLNGGQSLTATQAATFTKPGIYKVQLLATDRITGCTTLQESVLTINGVPRAAFTVADICQGQAVSFTETSTLSAALAGDALASWEWDMDYDGSSFTADYSGNGTITHTYPAAGTYRVALRVTSSKGCSDMLVKEVQVKPVPQAQLSYSYTQPICPGEPVTFTNLSNNSAVSFPAGVSYWLVIHDGTSNTRISIPEPTRAQQFTNTTNALKEYKVWLEAKANAPNSCTQNSDTLALQVKPGAMAGFIAPGYSALDPNCTPLALELLTTQATRDIEADRYIWTITQGTNQQQIIKNRGDADFENLQFTALNTTNGSLNYTVKLVAEKTNQCIVPAEAIYRVSPTPAADFTLSKVAETCELITYEVQVSTTSGIRAYDWTIFPEPENKASVVYGDRFQLVYKRPAVTAPSYEVDLQLITENFFDCASPAKTASVEIRPQVLDDVKAVVISNNDSGCSPLEVEFENQTASAPAGTQYSILLRHGSNPEQEVEPLSGNANTRFVLRFAREGNYQIWLKATAPDGCVRYQTIPAQVVVYPDARPWFSVDKEEGCAPLTVSLNKANSSGAIRTWTVTDLSTNQPVYGPAVFDPASSDTFSFIELQNSGTTNKQYRINLQTQTAQGCAADSSITVTVFPQPQASFELIGGDTVCEPHTIQLRNTSANGSGIVYTWEWGDGTTTTSSETTLSKTYTNTSYNAALTYTVRLTAASPAGCSAWQSAQVVVASRVTADFEADKLSGCAPLLVNFTNRSLGNSGAGSGWFMRLPGAADFEPVQGELTNYTFTNGGSSTLTYEVRYRAVNAQGCSDLITRQITVYPQVQLQISADRSEGCGPLEVTFANDNPQAGVQYTWQWGDGSENTITTTETSLQHSFENSSATAQRKYTVRITAENLTTGCSSTISREITVYPQLRADVVPSVTVGCSPLQVGFQNNTSNASTHSWLVRRKDNGQEVWAGTGSIPEIPPLLNTGSTTRIYEVIYTGTSAQGCSSQQRFDISVYPEVAAAFSMNVVAPACGPVEVHFTNTSQQEGVTYTWQWGDGSPAEVSADVQLSHTFYNDFTDRNRYYEITLTAENNSTGCRSISRQVVTVNPAVVVSVTPDKEEICAPEEVAFVNRSKNVSTHEWWYRLQGTTDKLEVRSTAEVRYLFSNATDAIQVYEVVYRGTSSTNCTATSIHTITVHPQLGPVFSLDNDRPNLPEAVVQITNTTPFAESWAHSWTFGDGTSSSEVYPGSKQYAAYGTYIITLTISNGRCTASYSQEVRVGDTSPVVDFEPVPVAGCAPLVVNFVNRSQFTDPLSYLWDFGDGTRSREENPSHTYYRPGLYEVSLTARNSTGETQTVTRHMVTVYEVPQANFDVWDRVVKVPAEPVRVANYSVGADAYLWDFGDGTTYTEASPVHYYAQPGIYDITLIATNQWGCADTLTLNQVVSAEAGGEVRIPNAFTPNTSGPGGGYIDPENREEWNKNDVFMPYMIGGIRKFNMKIYNRWGELLFESNDKNKGWDGYYRGQLCKSDVYAFKIQVEFSDGQSLQKIGDITLIR